MTHELTVKKPSPLAAAFSAGSTLCGTNLHHFAGAAQHRNDLGLGGISQLAELLLKFSVVVFHGLLFWGFTGDDGSVTVVEGLQTG